MLTMPYMIACLVFALSAIRLGERANDRIGRLIVAACATTSLWCGIACIIGPNMPATGLTEVARNLIWLLPLSAIARAGGMRKGLLRALNLIFMALLLPLLLQLPLAIINHVPTLLTQVTPTGLADGFDAALLLRMIFAVGALMIVHNLHSAMSVQARQTYGPVFATLALLWGGDLAYCAIAAIHASGMPVAVDVARGWLIAVTGLPLLLALRGEVNWGVRLSRTATFRSLGLFATLGYAGLVFVLTTLLAGSDPTASRLLLAVLVVSLVSVALFLLPARLVRARVKAAIVKHFFAHRYDYRAEWLRFTDTMGQADAAGPSLNQRMIQAIAEIADVPAGFLMTPEANGEFFAVDGWNREIPTQRASARFAELLRPGNPVALDRLRQRTQTESAIAAVPEWLFSDARIWAIVPLVHFEAVVGAVVLERPLLARELDWEDMDLLRAAGRQLASYLAEAHAQKTVIEARQFEEFNRRFAFIAHDIKNLVSQLTLVARNAERHADKPAFRADMVETLNDATSRMNVLLARLAHHHRGRAQQLAPTEVGAVIESVTARRRDQHPIVVAAVGGAVAIADSERLESALGHIVQNAIDASPPNEPVTVTLIADKDSVRIQVLDRGAGMTSEFISNQLFRPFTSTKNNGFGIGAYEARSLIEAMGGSLTVSSQIEEGTVFTISLPPAVAREERPAAQGERRPPVATQPAQAPSFVPPLLPAHPLLESRAA